jgi:hypothetical protein
MSHAVAPPAPSASPERLHRRELRGRALGILALGLGGAWAALDPLVFLLLYAWQWALALGLTLPVALGAGRWLRHVPHPGRALLAGATGLALVWSLGIALPLGLSWIAREPGLAQSWHVLVATRGAALWWPALALALLALLAGWQARPRGPAPFALLRRILFERASCHLAFLVLGPLLYAALLPLCAALGSDAPRSSALALAFTLCEAWPFLQGWRAAPADTAGARDRLASKLASKLARLRARRSLR